MDCCKKKKINKLKEHIDLIKSNISNNEKPTIINKYKDTKIIEDYYPDNTKIYKRKNDVLEKIRFNITKKEVENKDKINGNDVKKKYLIETVEKYIESNNDDFKKNNEDIKKTNHHRFQRLKDDDDFYKYNNLKISHDSSNISKNDTSIISAPKKNTKKKTSDIILNNKKKDINTPRIDTKNKNVHKPIKKNSKNTIKSSQMQYKIKFLKKLIKKKDDNKIFLMMKFVLIYFKAKILMKNEELKIKTFKKVIHEKLNKEIILRLKFAFAYYKAKILEKNEELKIKALKKIIFIKITKELVLKQKYSLLYFKAKMLEKNEKLKIKVLKKIICQKINKEIVLRQKYALIYFKAKFLKKNEKKRIKSLKKIICEKLTKEKQILFKYFFKFYKNVYMEIVNSKNNHESENLNGYLKKKNNNKLFDFQEECQNCILKKNISKRNIDEENNNIINNKQLKGIIREQESFDSDDEKPKKIYGFINESNNCYLNSSLQLLTRIKDLEKQILNFNDISKENITKGKLVVEFQKIFNLINNDEKAINPNKIKRVMGKIDEKYYLNNQEDASEFISDFLDALFSETNTENKLGKIKEIKINKIDKEAYNNFCNKFYKRRGYSFLSNIFYGILRHEKLCKNCNNIIIKFNAYNMLKLPFYELLENNKDRKLDLKEIVNNYVSEYKNDNAVCRNCKQKEIYSKTSIFTLPKYLIIFFARIVDNQYLYNEINYPKKFSFNNYFDENKKTDIINKNYILECVIEHTGGIYSGHYTALCPIDKNNKCWYKFNDSSCNEKNRDPQSKNAIILLYKSI